MSNKVFLNGRIHRASEARISIRDRAVMFGDGVFETVRAYVGRPFRLERHLARMAGACEALNLSLPFGVSEIDRAVFDLLKENHLEHFDARVRVTVTGGQAEGPGALDRPGVPSLFVTATPYTPPSAAQFQKGLSLSVSSIMRNSSSPLSSIKSCNYLDSLFARQEALDMGADDALMLNVEGQVAEATSSNVFAVSNGMLITPRLECGLLAGITRETIMEISAGLGIPCTEAIILPDDLAGVDELFITNSMVELLPVGEVGGLAVSLCPGPMTERLLRAYRELVEVETQRT